MNLIKTTFSIIQKPWFKYLLVGSTNFFVCVLIMCAVAALGLNYLVYTALGYLAGMINSYVLNGCITFRCFNQSTETKFLQLCLARLANLLDWQKISYFFGINFSLLCMVEFTEYFTVHSLLLSEYQSIFFGMLIYVVCGYQLNRRIVFTTN